MARSVSEQDARFIADIVVETMRNRQNEDQWTQYKRLVQLEEELKRAVEEIARRDATIVGQADQIANLKSVILAMSSPHKQEAPTAWQPTIPFPAVPGGTLTAPPAPNSTVIYNPSQNGNGLFEVPRQNAGE